MLISEVSRLSETWEQLNKQNQSKVLDVAQYDLRLERLANEKAKANQKYFASEREKEALTTQVTLYTRLSTNQKGVIEKLEREQQALSEKSLNAEKELAERIKAEQMLEGIIKRVQQELTDLQTKWTALRQQFDNVSEPLLTKCAHLLTSYVVATEIV
jgi:E3 ubiquitin-protein ligase BRE1